MTGVLLAADRPGKDGTVCAADSGVTTLIRDPRIPRLVGLTQGAEILGVSRQYVHQLVQEGKLPACMDTGTMVLLEEAVREFKARLDLERGQADE